MYLRFKLFNNTEAAVDLTQVQGTFTLEGTELELDASGNTLAPLNTIVASQSFRSTSINSSESDFNGRIVNTMLELGNYIRLEIPFENLTETANLTIDIYNLTGDLILSKSFPIFGEDLGNNPNVGVTENAPFLIYLVENLEGEYNPAEYTEEYNVSTNDTVYSNFVAYRKPYTNEVWFSDASNSPGDRSYFVTDANGNDILIGTTNGFVCLDEDSNIKQKVEFYRYQIVGSCPPRRIPLEGYPIVAESIQLHDGIFIKESTSTYRTFSILNRSLRKYTWVVDFNLYHNCLQCDDKCIVLGNETTAGMLLDFNDLTVLRINDTLTYPFDSYRFRYELIDREGRIEAVKDVLVPISYLYVFLLTELNNFQFIPQNTGDYIIKGQVFWYYNGAQIVECNISKSYTGKYWFEKQDGTNCNQPKINNLSLDDITVVVKKLNNVTKELDVLQTDTITQLGSIEYSFNEDGVYVFTISKGEESFEHVHVNYCTLRNCIEEVIKDQLCNQIRTYKNQREYYNINGLLMMAFTHFMLLHEEYALAYAYELLTPSMLSNLYTLQDTLDKATEYCTTCTSLTSGKPYIDSDCNCYD